MVELIAERGYQAVRILDLTKLAHVSRPTFYNLYKDKEELLLGAYEDIAGRTAKAVIEAFDIDGPVDERLQAAMRTFAELAKAEPDSMSLFLLGAFGAGGKALERRNRTLDAFERTIQASRDGVASEAPADLTVKVILGGIREVAAARLLEDRMSELPELTAELTAWATSYPPTMPDALKGARVPQRRVSDEGPVPASERARRARGPPAQWSPRPAAGNRRQKPARTNRRRDGRDRRREGPRRPHHPRDRLARKRIARDLL